MWVNDVSCPFFCPEYQTNKGSIYQTSFCVFPKHSPLLYNSKRSFNFSLLSQCLVMACEITNDPKDKRFGSSWRIAHVCAATAHVRVGYLSKGDFSGTLGGT